MKKILITGASGFIGKNTIKLLENKYSFLPLYRNSVDLLSIDSLLGLEKVDAVMHMAARTYVPDSYEDPYGFYHFNIQSTLNVAEFCRVKEVPQLIYLNSYCYGKPQYLPIDEKHPLANHSPYNGSKLTAERLLNNYPFRCTKALSLRLFNIYGSGQKRDFLIPTLLEQALREDTIEVKDLEPKRDYIYIKDLIHLFDLILSDAPKAGVYNVGSGSSTSVGELIELIIRLTSKECQIRSLEQRRDNEVLDCVADISALARDFKWRPRYNIESGLQDLIKELCDV